MDIMKMGKNPNFLGSWDIEEEPTHRITVTIDAIVDEEVVSAGQKEVCTICYFKEEFKPMILNITNKKRIAKLYHTKQTEKLVGKRIMITTEKVRAFGDVYDALRVVPALPAPEEAKEFKCEVCGDKIEPMGKMTAEQVGAYTKKKYGKCLCSKCATALASKDKEAEKSDSDKE